MKLSVSLMFSIGWQFPRFSGTKKNGDALSAGKSSDLGLPLGYLVCCSVLTEVRVLAAAADKAATRRRGRNLDERGSLSPLISEGTFIYLFERIPYIYIYESYTYEGICTKVRMYERRYFIFETHYLLRNVRIMKLIIFLPSHIHTFVPSFEGILLFIRHNKSQIFELIN